MKPNYSDMIPGLIINGFVLLFVDTFLTNIFVLDFWYWWMGIGAIVYGIHRTRRSPSNDDFIVAILGIWSWPVCLVALIHFWNK